MRNTTLRERLISSYAPRKWHYNRKHEYADCFRQHGNVILAEQLEDCQETEVLACCSNCGSSWYIINKCRLRVCPLCSYEVAKARGHYLIAMTRNMTHPKLLTLTMPLWTDEPQAGIRHIRHSFAKLRKTKLFKLVRGGAYQIELKIKPDGWHIHMHALIDAPYLPYQQLFTLWKRILGTKAPQIDIRAAQSLKAREYAAKYAAKSADFYSHPESVVDWYEATKGQRLFSTFGKWYNAKLEELTGQGELPQPKATCPNCKAQSTVFLARDGPMVYGFKGWNTVVGAIVGDQPEELPIDEIRSAVVAYSKELQNKRAARATKEGVAA